MGFSLGIVGLPNVGKSTLFNVLAQAKVDVSNYPFTTINPNTGVVAVPDGRLAEVQRIIGSPKAIPTTLEFFDIAGLVKGASQGEGLGNKFLSHIRTVDAIAHVVRCFTDSNITHVAESVDPIRDIELIKAELILADLQTVEKKMEGVRSTAKSGDKESLKMLHLLEKLKEELGCGQGAAVLSQEEQALLHDLSLLTIKPVLYVANVDESGNQAAVDKINNLAAKEKAQVIAICAKLESEITELSPEEGEEYLKSVGLNEFALPRLIRSGYDLLGLLTFFTANDKECRAWTVTKGTTAPQAAGKVHSDMEKGFIAAEVIHYQDLIAAGSHAKAREKGLVHTEGKQYAVQDGDLLLVKFVI